MLFVTDGDLILIKTISKLLVTHIFCIKVLENENREQFDRIANLPYSKEFLS